MAGPARPDAEDRHGRRSGRRSLRSGLRGAGQRSATSRSWGHSTRCRPRQVREAKRVPSRKLPLARRVPPAAGGRRSRRSGEAACRVKARAASRGRDGTSYGMPRLFQLSEGRQHMKHWLSQRAGARRPRWPSERMFADAQQSAPPPPATPAARSCTPAAQSGHRRVRPRPHAPAKPDVKAGDDFFAHANGKWYDNVRHPGRSRELRHLHDAR